MSLVNELEDWLRHIESQLVALTSGKVKEYKPFRESLEGKDFKGEKRKFDDQGNPVLAHNEGPNAR